MFSYQILFNRRHVLAKWIRAIALVCLLLGTNAIADSENIDRYLGASAKFEMLVSQKAREHKMPRITEAQAAEVIAILSDTQGFLKSTTYRLKDLNSLMDMCGKANAAVMSYALFDLKANVDPNSDLKLIAAQTQQLIGRNIRTFQDELSKLQPFLIRCMAMQIPLFNEFMSSLKPEERTDVSRAGLQRARLGMLGVYIGGLQSIISADLSDSYRLNLLESLAETAPAFVTFLPLDARKQILELAKAALPTAPSNFQLYLTKITEAMSDLRCEGLCSF